MTSMLCSSWPRTNGKCSAVNRFLQFSRSTASSRYLHHHSQSPSPPGTFTITATHHHLQVPSVLIVTSSLTDIFLLNLQQMIPLAFLPPFVPEQNLSIHVAQVSLWSGCPSCHPTTAGWTKGHLLQVAISRGGISEVEGFYNLAFKRWDVLIKMFKNCDKDDIID